MGSKSKAERPKRVALIGAWGYGNVGDDAYPIVWRHYLPDVEFILYNSDKPAAPPEADLYLFGGGGIIFDNGSAHFEYMSRYSDWAAEKGIPVGFSSVGVQARINLDDRTDWYVEEALARWPAVLGKAEFVTVRDPMTQAALVARGVSSDCFPDICHIIPGLESAADHFLTVIPGPGVSTTFPDFLAALDEKIREHPETPLIVMTTGAAEHDFLVDDLGRRYPVMATFKAEHTTVELALTVIKHSRFVFTGRYHGMVFSRAASRPFWRSGVMYPYKMLAEDLSVPLREAFGHVRRVAEFLGVEPRADLPPNIQA